MHDCETPGFVCTSLWTGLASFLPTTPSYSRMIHTLLALVYEETEHSLRFGCFCQIDVLYIIAWGRPCGYVRMVCETLYASMSGQFSIFGQRLSTAKAKLGDGITAHHALSACIGCIPLIWSCSCRLLSAAIVVNISYIGSSIKGHVYLSLTSYTSIPKFYARVIKSSIDVWDPWISCLYAVSWSSSI